ncbi:hypothetical protein [Spirosoma aerophilum]
MSERSENTPPRPGLPEADTVLTEESFMPPQELLGPLNEAAAEQPQKVYRILVTNQMDPYDKPVAEAELIAPSLEAMASQGDQFKGTARKAAKTSVADAPVEVFTDLKALIETLPSKQTMKNHKPKITEGAKSNRVEKEKRNVRVNAFLYAASRENDNDYHLIIGRAQDAQPFQCMNVEISGLPPADSRFFKPINTGRDAFKTFFKNKLPGTSYSFYSPPFPVVVEGSLFFDMSHATGSQPGPQDLRPFIPTVWEIHPITNIVFEP